MFELFSTIPGLNLLIVLVGIAISITANLIGHRGLDRRQAAEVAAMYAVGIIGFQGIVNFVVHTVWADAVAASIGWPARRDGRRSACDPRYRRRAGLIQSAHPETPVRAGTRVHPFEEA